MLVRVVDHRDRERWVNPVYVKAVWAKNPSESEVDISGWATRLRVKMPAGELIDLLNAAMPETTLAAVSGHQEATVSDQEAAQARRSGAAYGVEFGS